MWPTAFQGQRIVRLCAGGFSLCSALLLFFTLRHVSSPYPLYAALLLNGTVRAFNAPASQAFLPLLVPREVFQNAVAWNASVFQTATIAGPMLGGLLYGLSGSPLPVYALAVGCYLTASVLYGFFEADAGPPRPLPPEPAAFCWKGCAISGAPRSS